MMPGVDLDRLELGALEEDDDDEEEEEEEEDEEDEEDEDEEVRFLLDIFFGQFNEQGRRGESAETTVC